MIERRDFLKTAIAGAAGWMLAPSLFDEQAWADVPALHVPAMIGADGLGRFPL